MPKLGHTSESCLKFKSEIVRSRFSCYWSNSIIHYNPVLQRHCAILKRIGFVVVSTLSITKLLNQQETGCIHLGSKRSFLMRRRSVFHHIFPPNSKKVLCCIWWKVERQIFVLVPLFCLPKRKHCKQPVHRKKKLDDQCLTEYNEDFHCRDWSCTKPKY